MRLVKKSLVGVEELDLTAASDMAFQLIAFFMVLLNFGDAEMSQRIHLPASELAKPPDAPLVEPRYLQLTQKGTILFGAEEVTIQGIRPLLLRERQVLERGGEKTASDVTIVIRADAAAPTGEVQELIEVCQETGFEKFALRARQEEDASTPVHN